MLETPTLIDLFGEDPEKESVDLLISDVSIYHKVHSIKDNNKSLTLEFVEPIKLKLNKQKQHFILEHKNKIYKTKSFNDILIHLQTIKEEENTIIKFFNKMSQNARVALWNLIKRYSEDGTHTFSLFDIGDTDHERSREVLDEIAQRDFIVKRGDIDNPRYRLSRASMDSLIHDGILELEPQNPRFETA